MFDWGSDRRLASKRLYTAAGADIWHAGYAYDNDDNIIAITDLVTPSNSLAFGYDSGDHQTQKFLWRSFRTTAIYFQIREGRKV